MNKIRENIWIFLIVALACLLRLISVPDYPVGFTQDEAAIGYDAYSLLETGKDQWGEQLPLVLRSFGDFKLPLYSYISIPTVFIFGLNEFAVRLPAVIFGTLAVLFTFLMVRKMSGNEKLALWSAFLISISPWHIALSRGAFEANLTTFFMPMGVYLFYKGLDNSKWMMLSTIVFGLNMFSYHSARIITPLIVFGLIYFNRSTLKFSMSVHGFAKVVSKYKWSVGIFTVFCLVVFATMFLGSNNRAADVTIFNPTDDWFAMSQNRYQLIVSGLDGDIARVFENKIRFTTDQFIDNYFKYISPQFLFTDGVGDWNYGMIPGRGVLYLIEVISITVGLIAYFKGKGFKGMSFILFWILISPISAALTKGAGTAGTRAAVMMPAIQILSAYGVVYIGSLIKETKAVVWTKLYFVSAASIFIMSFCSFVIYYRFYAPALASDSMQVGRDELALYLGEIENDYEMIRVSRSISVPHIWIMFYQKTDPSVVQNQSIQWLEYDDGENVSIDQYDGYTLGKYVFGNIFYEARQDEVDTLFVGRPEDFPDNVNPKKIIFDTRGKPAVYIVEISQRS